jgi:monoterpene epsilon-lactone hydrolase
MRLAALVFLLIIGITPLGAEDGVWIIREREVPPPTDVSPQLRESIRNAPQPDVAKAQSFAVSTPEEWREENRRLEPDNQARAKAALDLAESYGVSVVEGSIAGVTVHRLTPFLIDEEHVDHLFIYVHGGAYVRGAGLAGIGEGVMIAHGLRMRVLSIDYRMPPDHPYPAGVEDVVAVWRELIKEYDPATIALGGSSAGGGLTLGSVHWFKKEGLPLPGALFAGTPAVDITKTGDTWYTNAGIDRSVVTWEGHPAQGLGIYRGNTDPTDPGLSPIHGDVTGFPPTYLISGTRDLLLSDTVRMHRKLRRAGVVADLHVYEGQSHGEFLRREIPESQEHFAELNAFVKKHLAGNK